MRRAIALAAWLYAALSLLALALVLASSRSWLGVERTPLSVMYAMMLAFPWTMMLARIGHHGPAVGAIVLITGMAVNFFLLRWLSRQFT